MTNNFLTKSADIRLQITKARIRLIVASGITGGRSRAQRFRINMKRAVNPFVVDGNLWADYYSKDVMMSSAAKESMVFPDKKSLPNLVVRDAIKQKSD